MQPTATTRHIIRTDEVLHVTFLHWSLFVVTVHSPTFPIPWLRCSTLKTNKARTLYLGRVEAMVERCIHGPAFRLSLWGWEVNLGRA